MSVVQRQALRLKICGIEFPIIGCTASGGQGQAAVAGISVPPHDTFHDIKPGSPVQVYYYDGRDWTWYVNESRTYSHGPLPAEDPRRWKLLHNGTFRGYSSQRSRAGQWATTIQSVAPSFIYNRVQQYFGGFKYSGSASYDMSFLGASKDQPGRRTNSKLMGASAPTEVYNVLKQGADLYGGSWIAGIRLLLKKICFNNHPFWETEYKRLRVGDMVGGFDMDQTSHNLMPLKDFKKLVVDQLGAMGSQTAIRDVVNFLLESIYHAWWETPCPYLSLGTIGFPTQDKHMVSGDDPVYPDAWPGAQLGASYMLPDIWWACPPVCNVLYPDNYIDFETARDYYAEATRMFLRTEVNLRSQAWARDAHYAPNMEKMGDFFSSTTLPASFNARNATTLLPWERFTGPISNIHMVSQTPGKTKSKALSAFLSHVANYDYWSLRTERSGRGSGPFNPDLLVGLPALVIRDARVLDPTRQPGGSAYIAKGAGRRGVYPQALLGRLVGVTHQITQTSAMTFFEMGNLRFHDEDFDLDGETGDDVEGMLNSREKEKEKELRFFGDSWDTENIGTKVYKPLTGRGSIADVTGNAGRIQQAVDGLVHDYAERRATFGADISSSNLRITSRPVMDIIQAEGVEAYWKQGSYPSRGYDGLGFLSSSLMAVRLRATGDPYEIRKVKEDVVNKVDKDQVAVASRDTEADGLVTKILEINKERRTAAAAAAEQLQERVIRG